MAETRLLGIKDASYNGIVDMEGLKAVLIQWGKDNDYKIAEAKSHEQTYPDGKEMMYEGTFERDVSDWLKLEMKLKLDFRKMEEIEIEIHDVTKKMWKGKCKATIKAFMKSDTENKWTKAPGLHITRMIMDKFFTKSDVGTAEKRCSADQKSLLNEIKSYLNLERWPEP